MNSLVIIFFSACHLFTAPLLIDQRPDLLIIGSDTILLKSFPLEDLGFSSRPFQYGRYDFPDYDCVRGYQAVWKVINNKLFLAEIIKADDSQERIDIEQYFLQNNYIPIISDGLIFADWFSMDLRPFPRNYNYLGCVWKNQRPKRGKPSLRFKNGLLLANHYHSK